MAFTNLSRRSFVKGAGLLSCGAAASAVLSGCGGAPAAEADEAKKVLRWAQSNAKQGLDMQKSTNSGMSAVSDPVVEAPLRFTADNELVPCLLTEIPTVEDDGVTYHCTLKEGIKCHDGSTLTANDVKYSFTRMFLPQTAGLSTYMYDMIVGAQEVMDGTTTDLAGVTVEDDTHFTITLQYPMATFVKNLGINYANVFPQKACEEAGEKWGYELNYVGSGPFKLVENDDSTHMVFERFPEYHLADEIHLDGIDVTFEDDNNTKLMKFKNGDIDMCDLTIDLLPTYQQDPDVKDCINYSTGLGTWFVNLNLNTPALQDVRVRQAMSLAIDRQAIIDNMLSGAGVPASGFLNQGVPGFDSSAEAFPYDPDKAKALLAEAGASNVKLSCVVRTGQYESIMVAVQNYLKEVGIDMDVQTVDNGVWASDWVAGEYEVTALAWYPLYADADNQMYTYFHSSNASGKGSFYNNPEFDALMDEARRSADEEHRAELYREADNIMSRTDYACLPLFYPQLMFVTKPNVKNAKLGNLIYHFRDIDMDAEQ